LHGPVDTKYPERLDKQIQEQQQTKVCQEFSLHPISVFLILRENHPEQSLKNIMIFVTKLNN